MKTRILRNLLPVWLISCICMGIPAYADDFDNAKSLVANFKKDEYDKIKKLNAEEVGMIVDALKKSDDGRKEMDDTSAYIVGRMMSEAQANIDNFSKKYTEAKNALDKLMDDPNFKDKKSEIAALKDQLDTTMLSMEKLTFRVKGGNHPVIQWFKLLGNEAHAAYSDCDRKGVKTDDGEIDCVKKVSDDDCRIIEIKPDNDLAKAKAKDNQLPRYLKSMNKKDSSYFAQLVSSDAKFSSCDQQFSGWWVLYKIEVEVDADGNTPSTRFSWGSPQKVYDKGYK